MLGIVEARDVVVDELAEASEVFVAVG